MLVNPAAAHRMLRRALPGSPSLSRRRDPGIGRERCDGAGGRVRGGCGSAVSGRGRRARMRGIGRAGAVLHIRPGPAGDGSAESRGNSPALNAVEILPCAERVPLHMGARPLKTNILGKPRNHAENSESTRTGDPLQCATAPHGPGRPVRAGWPQRRRGTPATGPGRSRPARQRPSAPAPVGSPSPARTLRKTAPTAPTPTPGTPLPVRKAQ